MKELHNCSPPQVSRGGDAVTQPFGHRARRLSLPFPKLPSQLPQKEFSRKKKNHWKIYFLSSYFLKKKILNTAACSGLLFANTYLLLQQNKSSHFCFCLSLRHADKNIFYSSVVKGYSHLTLNTDMLLGSLPGSLCHPGFRSICLSAKSPFWSVIFHFDTRNAFWSNFSSPLNSRHNGNGNHIAVAMWRFPQFGVYLLRG